ncbi:hypothetical protein FK529_18320 [Tsukamurella asaccharolytica]|uniref:Uncharacterized protein n=1 Tax=Tsukamurella asaccharolytica TaxID=2592067 RepID=A0A5C5R478_9ACTN|nr:hypothetical protein [Tsukamurella asaccharolytica]TWS17829.1 hypothetical protein FK529_18320 [Tsukamurella asaccharolytica]
MGVPTAGDASPCAQVTRAAAQRVRRDLQHRREDRGAQDPAGDGPAQPEVLETAADCGEARRRAGAVRAGG